MTNDLEHPHLELQFESGTKTVALETGVACRIGRSQQNAVTLDDNQVSRHHAMVQATAAGRFILSDLGSRNGTFLNGRRITAPVELEPDDRILIGQHEFVFRGPSRPTPSALTTQAGETMVGISQKLITVLVTDVRDFTGLSRKLGEHELSRTMGTLFREAGEILDDYEASGQKYIGDAIMAFWVHPPGAPTLREVTEIFAALRRLFDLVEGLQERQGLSHPIRIGAGVNTGLAAVGNIGSAASADHTAVSEAVNFAFRLESATKNLHCDVALGAATYSLVSEHLNLDGTFRPARTPLKGFEGTWEVYTGSRDNVNKAAKSLAQLTPDEKPATRTRRAGFSRRP